MSEAAPSIFNKKASEKLRSPDDLDRYVRVTNPSVWLVLAACLVLMLGLLCWGIFGTVSTSVDATGVIVDNQPMCFLSADKRAEIEEGDKATFGGKNFSVGTISSVPVSRSEAQNVLKSEYLASTLMDGDWSYYVVFEGDTSGLNENVPISMSITTEQYAPISLILGGSRQ